MDRREYISVSELSKEQKQNKTSKMKASILKLQKAIEKGDII